MSSKVIQHQLQHSSERSLNPSPTALSLDSCTLLLLQLQWFKDLNSESKVHHIAILQPMTSCDWFTSVFQFRTLYSLFHRYWSYVRLCRYQSASMDNHRSVCVCVHWCVRVYPSAPGFTLGSASSQTVCSLPGTVHQSEGLTTTLLH